MPDFDTKLSMQEDGSLGFVYDVPKAGFPLYGGKGTLYNKVSMSNRGLQGIGNIKYLTGSFNSDQFIFYKDSVVTVGKTATILPGPLKGTEFAKVNLLPGYQMKWAVRQDSMYLTTQDQGRGLPHLRRGVRLQGHAHLHARRACWASGAMDGPQSFIRSSDFRVQAHPVRGQAVHVQHQVGRGEQAGPHGQQRELHLRSEGRQHRVCPRSRTTASPASTCPTPTTAPRSRAASGTSRRSSCSCAWRPGPIRRAPTSTAPSPSSRASSSRPPPASTT